MTPAVVKYLIPQMWEPGDVVSRSTLVMGVGAEHERRGGLPPRGSAVAVVKKALQGLAAEGAVESVSQGFWQINSEGAAEDAPRSAETGPIEVGEGAEIVYVYYFPAYRDQAALLGRDMWPMKIGMTASDLTPRLVDQCGTAMPERPIVGLIYRTDQGRIAEKMLHSTLETRGRRIKEAPGKEWFATNLAEVRSILDFVTGN